MPLALTADTRSLGANVAEIVTGEAVVLELPCARFPSRAVALFIDLVTQALLIAVLILGAGVGAGHLDGAALAAMALTTFVLILIGYPVLWETTTRGRSPGKFAMGLRVVSDDGGPERFRQALVRGLATIVDFWLVPFLFVPALICSLLSEKGKRLGDVFAGTFVIQQRLPTRRYLTVTPSMMPPELAAWAAGLELSGLTDQTAAIARGYLGRLAQLTPGARAQLGEHIATAVMGQVSPPPPPGTPAPAYLGAVLAERNRREHARLAGTAGPAGYAAAPWAAQQTAQATPVWAPPSGPRAGQQDVPYPALAASTTGPGAAWKTAAAGEGEESGPGRPGQPDEPSAAAAGGFVPPQ